MNHPEKREINERVADYLENDRSISIDIAMKFGVYSAQRKDGSQYIAFPYGEEQYTHSKFRNVDDKKDTFQGPKNQPRSMFGIDLIKDIPPESARLLVITEGEFDALCVAHLGMPVVSVPDGAPNKPGTGAVVPRSDRKFSFLWLAEKLHPSLKKFDEILLLTDNDEPGMWLAEELAVRIGKSRCTIASLPTDCKDANDVLIKHGVEELSRVIQDRESFLRTRLSPINSRELRPLENGLDAGWPALANHFRPKPGNLVIITGVPGSGKSEFALAWAMNMARIHGFRTAMLEFENGDDRTRPSMIRYAEGFGIDNPDQWSGDHFLTIDPPEDESTDIEDATSLDDDMDLFWLRDTISVAVKLHECEIVLIDPWNELDHVWDKGESETLYTNNALKYLKRWARKLGIILAVVAHPGLQARNKDVEDISLYDISGSAAWNNKADIGIVVARPDQDSSRAIINVVKSKHHLTLGRPGSVEMYYQWKYATYVAHNPAGPITEQESRLDGESL